MIEEPKLWDEMTEQEREENKDDIIHELIVGMAGGEDKMNAFCHSFRKSMKKVEKFAKRAYR